MTRRLDDDIAPDFELLGVDGHKTRLSDYRGKQHVVLVFNRGFE